jgi:hypothetical protein
LKKRAITLYPFKIPVEVAHIDDLIASKMSASRPKDKAVVTELMRIQESIQDGKRLAGLERFSEGIEFAEQ